MGSYEKIAVQFEFDLVLVAQTVTQASWGVMKEDRMDVEPCYLLCTGVSIWEIRCEHDEMKMLTNLY